MSFKNIVKFGLLVGATGIFIDAAIAHGIFWENDPYWTYWITKTFLISTSFILGTALLGTGILRGAIITIFFTAVLQAYYSWFAPVGLPQEPMWFIVKDMWTEGYVTHYLTIFTGYLFALWIWKRNGGRAKEEASEEARSLATWSLTTAVLIVVLDGVITQGILLRNFPGITYFIQHLLISCVFVSAWSVFMGFDEEGQIAGGFTLSLLYVLYGMFLSPTGLPGPNPHYLGYSDLWFKTFPGVLISALMAFAITTKSLPKSSSIKALTVILIIFSFFTVSPRVVLAKEGIPANVSTKGDGKMIIGNEPYNLDSSIPMNGTINIEVENVGDRWSPLMNQDIVNIVAEFNSGGTQYKITIDKPMVRHPLGKYTTWFGVTYHQRMHGNTGIGTNKLPDMVADVAVWGYARVEKNNQLIAKMAPAHVMVMKEGTIKGITLEVDAEDKNLIGVDNGYINVIWPNIDSFNLDSRIMSTRKLLGYVIFLILIGILINLINKVEKLIPEKTSLKVPVNKGKKKIRKNK